MSYNSGWIKLHRKLLGWEWYDDINVRITFLHCLLKANYEDRSWKGLFVPRGSFVSSLGNLSKEIGISEQNLRTAIRKLKLTNELTSKSTSKNTMFTVVSYDLYQTDNEQTNERPTNDQQTTNKQLTTTKEDNNIKNKRSKEDIANEIVEAYHLFCPNLPKVQKITSGRITASNKRLEECGSEELRKVFEFAAASDFLNGKNDNNWTANFDWILKPANYAKILEGNYKNKKNGKDRAISVEDFNESIERHFRE